MGGFTCSFVSLWQAKEPEVFEAPVATTRKAIN
jgi:hypothetical protein